MIDWFNERSRSFKILLVALATCILLHHRGRILAECMSWVAAIIYTGVCVQWMLCYRFYELTFVYRCGTPLTDSALS